MRAALHRTHIGLVERGERNLSLVAAHSIAAAFDLELSELIGLAEDDLEVGEPSSRRRGPRRVDQSHLRNTEFITDTTASTSSGSPRQ